MLLTSTLARNDVQDCKSTSGLNVKLNKQAVAESRSVKKGVGVFKKWWIDWEIMNHKFEFEDFIAAMNVSLMSHRTWNDQKGADKNESRPSLVAASHENLNKKQLFLS